jgi:hypothetical protein
MKYILLLIYTCISKFITKLSGRIYILFFQNDTSVREMTWDEISVIGQGLFFSISEPNFIKKDA